jgi:hypothetical protein
MATNGITKEDKAAFRRMGNEDGKAGRNAATFSNTHSDLVNAYHQGHKRGKKTHENLKAQIEYERTKW